MAALVDTNVLVYRVDPRDRRKQAIAESLLRAGIVDGSLRLPHQAILEFVAVTTRPLGRDPPLLSFVDAVRETEDLLREFTVLYPTEALIRLALRGAAAYQLSWFDAHLWAFAEHHALDTIVTEDFQHDRRYGCVRILNPFIADAAR